jgi:hypothetical protein
MIDVKSKERAALSALEMQREFTLTGTVVNLHDSDEEQPERDSFAGSIELHGPSFQSGGSDDVSASNSLARNRPRRNVRNTAITGKRRRSKRDFEEDDDSDDDEEVVFSGDDEDEEVRPRSRPKSARKSATIQ